MHTEIHNQRVLLLLVINSQSSVTQIVLNLLFIYLATVSLMSSISLITIIKYILCNIIKNT